MKKVLKKFNRTLSIMLAAAMDTDNGTLYCYAGFRGGSAE